MINPGQLTTILEDLDFTIPIDEITSIANIDVISSTITQLTDEIQNTISDLPTLGDLVKGIPIISDIFNKVCSSSTQDKLQSYVDKYKPLVEDGEKQLIEARTKFEAQKSEATIKLDNYIQLLQLSIERCQEN